MLSKLLKFKKIIATLCLIAVVMAPLWVIMPQTAQATPGVDVGIDTTLNFHSIMDYLKTFTLDRIAVMIANQILQRMTASIVGWINSGFQGGPAFLQNPEGFFLDVADQVTGEMVAGNGQLASALCSPFNLDIRLSLALNQVMNKRYTCTLGSFITNTANGNMLTVNGQSIGGFMRGDFNQGGLSAFVALTTEPQNNPFGASLMAQGDLQAQISAKQATIKADLSNGAGFMSWQKCDDVTAQWNSGEFDTDYYNLAQNQVNAFNAQDQMQNSKSLTAPTGKTTLGSATSIQRKVDSKTGKVTYQDCKTQTPGSLVGGAIQRQLNVPTDKMVLVKTISDSIDAILGALMNQMITQGLAALSGSGSGVNYNRGSYVNQLEAEAATQNNSTSWKNAQANVQNTVNPSNPKLADFKSLYDQAIALVSDSKARLTATRACFSAKLTSDNLSIKYFAQDQISKIDSLIGVQLDPLTTSLKAKQTKAISDQQTAANASQNYATNNTDLSAMYGQFDNLQTTTANSGTELENNLNTIAQTDTTAAQADLDSTTQQVKVWNAQALQFQTNCGNTGSSIYGSSYYVSQ